ncbi:uncharacterized protein CTRU02_215415 [Colletotrichum truncatum]|uniref:Uncharacterized protein n=1 Tax=Colletotrichum truncatum TaxID=5467 RepID=A0ACC3YCD7_COLTU|nr:uncharacterized protein CTRU02_15804 [Colletotrichum truncatum]XP_036584569.1 uncharacterized protein CTRU02_05644 [Colletotrichum truncatum]KAF6780652.1 hypothetical protein CTRU02_15804 [Colletotrichum truncatum]KAF6794087.1 hypothetical protein CTRU02_05644 [Colletotrichum truncatum]
MEIWAFANVYTAAPPRVSAVPSSSGAATELSRICTWATGGDAITTTAVHTTALPNTFVSNHRFWNASLGHEALNVSTIASIQIAATTITATTKPGGNVEPSWTYHKPTVHTTATLPVSATASHDASFSRFSIYLGFFLAVSLWGRLR